MNVEEAIARIDEMSDTTVLVAKPPLSWGSEAMFVELTADYRVPESVKDAGYEYLLGREEIEQLLRELSGKAVSSKTVAEFIVYYAVTDCQPTWIDDIPDQ